jgi:hypothetical protein
MRAAGDVYREGYEQGRQDNFAGNVGEAMLGMLRDDPGGYYAAGYRDGAAGKKFNPPSEKDPKAGLKPSAGPRASDAEKAWYQFCDMSEFISLDIAREFFERLKGTVGSMAAYYVGLHKFYQMDCPSCGVPGYFKAHFLGAVSHPACGARWYVSPGAYIGYQVADVYHSGLRAGGAMKHNADRKGDRASIVDGLIGFLFGVVFRGALAAALIPVQAVVSLSQANPGAKGSD